ncbi:MAG: carboxypeptidase-like regulatory domain-containing protein [Terriglobia bacterium]
MARIGSSRGDALRSCARRGAALCVCAILLGAAFLSAKQKPPLTKTVSGAVLKSSSQGVTGASVLLTDMQTHVTSATYSGANGLYSFPGLNPNHDYQIQAKYHGRSSDVREVSSFDTRVRAVINLVLNPPSKDTGAASAPK